MPDVEPRSSKEHMAWSHLHTSVVTLVCRFGKYRRHDAFDRHTLSCEFAEGIAVVIIKLVLFSSSDPEAIVDRSGPGVDRGLLNEVVTATLYVEDYVNSSQVERRQSRLALY